MLLGNQEAPRSILASGTFLRENLVIKKFLPPFFLFRWFKRSICQLMAKEYALSTGNLPLGGLPRNSVASIADSPDMTSAVDCGCKALNQPMTSKQRIITQQSTVSMTGWVDLLSIERRVVIWAATWENRIFAYAKTKPQISCVTAQLISAFVFATWILLLPSSEILSL